MSPILQKLDYAFPRNTVIVGQDVRCLQYRSNWDKNNKSKQEIIPDVVAIVFVEDRENPSGGSGGIQFHATLMAGLRPIGPVHIASFVDSQIIKGATLLKARVGASPDLGGSTMLNRIHVEQAFYMTGKAKDLWYGKAEDLWYYIGVKKCRNCSVGEDRPRAMTSLEFHEVIYDVDAFLTVREQGIRRGDHFRFFTNDPKAAQDSINRVNDFFKLLNSNYTDASTSNQQPTGSIRKMSVFGCLIFAPCIRRFFGYPRLGLEAQPFLETFLGVPFAGAFCKNQIASMDQSIYEDSQDEGRCFEHQFGTVYLALSYTPLD